MTILSDYFVQQLVYIIDSVTILVIFVSFAYAVLEYVFFYSHKSFGRPKKHYLLSIDKNRLKLGENLLFALEILICADIILSVQEPTLEHLTQLGIIVVIRILIAYFLQREIREIEDMAKFKRKRVVKK